VPEPVNPPGCDSPAPASLDGNGGCRCLVCGRCGHHTGDNNQGHWWAWCTVTRTLREHHFCCPGDCELAAARLDLDAIRASWDHVDIEPGDPAADVVPALIAEVERLRRLLGAGPSPSSEAYEAMATAMQAYRSLAEEMLRHFRACGMDGDRVISMRSEAIPVETYNRWRTALGGGS
jgi:hypothetical protein